MSRAPAMCQDAPDFEAETTERRVQFHAWPGDAGGTLFSALVRPKPKKQRRRPLQISSLPGSPRSV